MKKRFFHSSVHTQKQPEKKKRKAARKMIDSGTLLLLREVYDEACWVDGQKSIKFVSEKWGIGRIRGSLGSEQEQGLLSVGSEDLRALKSV